MRSFRPPKGQLFNDNPKGHPRLKTLGYGTEEKALNSVKKLKAYPTSYQRQAATTMYYRAKYHANQTRNMRKAMKVYNKFLRTLRIGTANPEGVLFGSAKPSRNLTLKNKPHKK